MPTTPLREMTFERPSEVSIEKDPERISAYEGLPLALEASFDDAGVITGDVGVELVIAEGEAK